MLLHAKEVQHAKKRLRQSPRALHRRRFRGTALVEMALLMPVLLFLLTGIVDVARGYSMVGIVTNAARQGARYGATRPSDTAGITSRVQEEVQNAGLSIDSNKVETTYPDGSPARGQRLKVTVTYNYKTLIGGVIGMSNFSIRRDCTMVIL